MPASLLIMIRAGERGIETMTKDAPGIMTRDVPDILVMRDTIRTRAIGVDRDRAPLLLPEIPYNLPFASLVILLDMCRFLKLLDLRCRRR